MTATKRRPTDRQRSRMRDACFEAIAFVSGADNDDLTVAWAVRCLVEQAARDIGVEPPDDPNGDGREFAWARLRRTATFLERLSYEPLAAELGNAYAAAQLIRFADTGARWVDYPTHVLSAMDREPVAGSPGAGNGRLKGG